MLRDEISRPLGFQDFAVTTAINADTLVISTALSDRYPNDDQLNGWYLIIEDRTNAGVIRRVQDYNGEVTTPIGQITVRGADLLDDSSNLANCAVHRFHPTDIQRAFNRARQDVFPDIAITRDYQLLVTGPDQLRYTVPSSVRRIRRVYLGNRLRATHPGNIYQNNNPDLESWGSATSPTDWTITGAGGSVNREEQTAAPLNLAVLEGSSSARITVTTNLVTFLHDSPTLDVATEGLEVNMSVWVYSMTANRVTPSLAGTAIGSHTAGLHTGTGWERIAAAGNTDSDGGTLTSGVSISAGAAMSCYVDELICIIGPSEALEGHWSPVTGYEHVPAIDGASDGGRLYLPAAPREKQVLRLVGANTLSSVSADTDTVEYDGEVLEPLYDKTREYLCAERADSYGFGSDGYTEWKSKERDYRDRYDQWVAGKARSLAPMPGPKVPYVRVV